MPITYKYIYKYELKTEIANFSILLSIEIDNILPLINDITYKLLLVITYYELSMRIIL